MLGITLTLVGPWGTSLAVLHGRSHGSSAHPLAETSHCHVPCNVLPSDGPRVRRPTVDQERPDPEPPYYVALRRPTLTVEGVAPTSVNDPRPSKVPIYKLHLVLRR